MNKKFEANDKTAQEPSGGKRNAPHCQGKALQMNDNSVGGKKPAKAPAAPGDKPNDGEVQGKGLQVNENSAGE